MAGFPDIESNDQPQQPPPQAAPMPAPDESQAAPTPSPENQQIQQVRQNLFDRIQRYSTPPASGGPVRRLLQNFIGGMGQAMMHDAGLMTNEEQVQNATRALNQIDSTQATIDYHNQLIQQMQQQKMITPTLDQARMMGNEDLAGQPMPVSVFNSLTSAASKKGVAQTAAQSREAVAQINQGMMMPIDESTRVALGLPEGITELPLNQLNKAIQAKVRPQATVQGATDQYQYNRVTGQKTPMHVGNPRVAMIQERARLTPFETVVPGTNIPTTISQLQAVQSGAPKVPIATQQKLGGQYALYNDAYGILDKIDSLADQVNLDDPKVRARVTAGYAAIKDPASKGLAGEILSNFLARQPINGEMTPQERELVLAMGQGKSAGMGLRSILGQAGANEMQQRMDAALFPGGNAIGSKASIKAQTQATRGLLGRLSIGQPQVGLNAPNQPGSLANKAGGGGIEPPRPANVPANYVFQENGPKGRGWYRP